MRLQLFKIRNFSTFIFPVFYQQVYAVGTYIEKEAIKAIDKGILSNKESLQNLLCNPTLLPRTIRIVTHWTIPSYILTKGILDSLQPRLKEKKTEEEMKELETLLYDVMPKGDVKSGTEIYMHVNKDTFILLDDGGIYDDVDDSKDTDTKEEGTKKIQDVHFCEALCEVYFGDQPVSPDHKEDVLNRMPKILE